MCCLLLRSFFFFLFWLFCRFVESRSALIEKSYDQWYSSRDQLFSGRVHPSLMCTSFIRTLECDVHKFRCCFLEAFYCFHTPWGLVITANFYEWKIVDCLSIQYRLSDIFLPARGNCRRFSISMEEIVLRLENPLQLLILFYYIFVLFMDIMRMLILNWYTSF